MSRRKRSQVKEEYEEAMLELEKITSDKFIAKMVELWDKFTIGQKRSRAVFLVWLLTHE